MYNTPLAWLLLRFPPENNVPPVHGLSIATAFAVGTAYIFLIHPQRVDEVRLRAAEAQSSVECQRTVELEIQRVVVQFALPRGYWMQRFPLMLRYAALNKIRQWLFVVFFHYYLFLRLLAWLLFCLFVSLFLQRGCYQFYLQRRGAEPRIFFETFQAVIRALQLTYR